MFRIGELWRNRNCLDIDFIVTRVSYQNAEYVKLNLLYWNRHGKYVIMPASEQVKIYRKDFHNWELLSQKAL